MFYHEVNMLCHQVTWVTVHHAECPGVTPQAPRTPLTGGTHGKWNHCVISRTDGSLDSGDGTPGMLANCEAMMLIGDTYDDVVEQAPRAKTLAFLWTF